MKKHLPLLSSCLVLLWVGANAEPVTPPAEPAQNPGAAPPSIQLADYQLVTGPIEVEGVKQNLSGLAFDTSMTNLLAVINYPPELLQLSLAGEVLARYELGGGADMEAVEAIGANRFLVADEGAGIALAFRFVMTPRHGRQVAQAPTSTIAIDKSLPANRGLEGLAWDTKGRRVFGVKEKVPVQLFEVTIPEAGEGGEPVVNVAWTFKEKNIAIDDASGLHWDAETGHLLVLSHESHCVVEVTPDGEEIARLPLPELTQPEGIALGPDRTLYIVGEPNQFCVYRRAAPGK